MRKVNKYGQSVGRRNIIEKDEKKEVKKSVRNEQKQKQKQWTKLYSPMLQRTKEIARWQSTEHVEHLQLGPPVPLVSKTSFLIINYGWLNCNPSTITGEMAWAQLF